MKRNPKVEFIKDIKKRSKAKKIYPLFFFEKCDKCGMEFKREIMYEYESPYLLFERHKYYIHGCKECYPTFEQFSAEMKDKTEKDLKDFFDFKDNNLK